MALSASDLFSRGVELEATRPIEALACYTQAIKLDPNYAAAHLNQGVVFYSQKELKWAEDSYRNALKIDPAYAIAHFNLGIVLDDTNRPTEALEAYNKALYLIPNYADAHYNAALIYDRMKQPRMAIKHLRAYLQIDRKGAWADTARAWYRRLLKADGLKIVYRREQG